MRSTAHENRGSLLTTYFYQEIVVFMKTLTTLLSVELRHYSLTCSHLGLLSLCACPLTLRRKSTLFKSAREANFQLLACPDNFKVNLIPLEPQTVILWF